MSRQPLSRPRDDDKTAFWHAHDRTSLPDESQRFDDIDRFHICGIDERSHWHIAEVDLHLIRVSFKSQERGFRTGQAGKNVGCKFHELFMLHFLSVYAMSSGVWTCSTNPPGDKLVDGLPPAANHATRVEEPPLGANICV